MRAFDPEVVEAIWSAISPLVPVPVDDHEVVPGGVEVEGWWSPSRRCC
jgi:hypothetical protein